jgi:hypothetical protein
MTDKEQEIFLSLHNSWVTRNLGEEIITNVNSIPQLERYLREKGNRRYKMREINEICSAISFLEKHLNEDMKFLESVEELL